MSKAVIEISVGALAIAAAIAMPGIGAGLAWMTLTMQNSIIAGLVSTGASEVLAGASSMLSPQQGGISVGTTNPIGPWQYIYGTQKVGGIKIFEESNNSQGTSNHKELHRVYALACHPCALGNWQLRMDGKQVLVTPSMEGGYNSYSPTQIKSNITSISRANGLVTIVLASGISGLDGTNLQLRQVSDNTFNGTWIVTQPNPNDSTTFSFVCGGTDTTTSGGYATTTYADYKDKIHVELLDGNHRSTFSSLLGSGTSWGPTDLCLGRTMAYVRMGYDDTVFPSSIPNVSFVIDGKNDILDPFTGTRGFTTNAALCIADFLSLSPTLGGFGLAIGSDISTGQLTAAKNLCNESVPLAGGGTTPRYTCNTTVLLTSTRGSILQGMLSSCAGRVSYQGGVYSIHPASFVGSTLDLTDADIIGSMTWKPRMSIRDTCNAVKGTFVSPENGYQQADVPPYMQNYEHGYAVDLWLAEDRAERIFHDTNFPCTDSSAIAQRLAKIELMRTRHQGRGTIHCNMKAYKAVALDVIRITHPRYTWVTKYFEVLSSRLVMDKTDDVPVLGVELDIAETDPNIYDWWYDSEQLTPQGYKQPNNIGVQICAPPEDVTLYSGPGETINGITYPSTHTVGADGTITNSLYLCWTQPNDANVVFGGHLEVQWQAAGWQGGGSTWTAWGNISPTASSVFLTNIGEGVSYNVQIRAVNCAGVPSEWVETGNMQALQASNCMQKSHKANY